MAEEYFKRKQTVQYIYIYIYCSIVDERPKGYRANYKQCREKAQVCHWSIE